MQKKATRKLPINVSHSEIFMIQKIKNTIKFVQLMSSSKEQNKLALISCIELTLMRSGNTNYNLVICKLNALYDAGLADCYNHPDYLRIILKEVYKDNYQSIVNEIKMCLDDLLQVEEIANFMKVMQS